jgi:hypothetical protein
MASISEPVTVITVFAGRQTATSPSYMKSARTPALEDSTWFTRKFLWIHSHSTDIKNIKTK